jgi:hypothetical protein
VVDSRAHNIKAAGTLGIAVRVCRFSWLTAPVVGCQQSLFDDRVAAKMPEMRIEEHEQRGETLPLEIVLTLLHERSAPAMTAFKTMGR